MLKPKHRSAERVQRLLRCSLLVGLGLCAASLAACGARSSVDLVEGNPAGGAGPRANPPDAAHPAGGAGSAGAGVAGMAAVAGAAGAAAVAGAGGMMPHSSCEAVTV